MRCVNQMTARCHFNDAAGLISPRVDGTRRKPRRRRAMLLRANRHARDLRQGSAEARRIPPQRTAQRLRQILDAHPRAHHFTVRRIMAALGDAPQGPTLALFSAAGVLPVPDVGNLSGIVTCAIGAQLVLRQSEAELPRIILKRKISRSSLVSLISAVTHVLRRAETVIETRWSWVFHRRTSVAVGVLLVILGIASLTPVVGLPVEHSASAFAMAVGLAERDGLAVLIGAVAGIASLAIAIANVISGPRLWATTKRWFVDGCKRVGRRVAVWLLDHFGLGELLRIDRSRLLLQASDFADPIDGSHTTPSAKCRRSLKARARRIRLAESQKIGAQPQTVGEVKRQRNGA